MLAFLLFFLIHRLLLVQLINYSVFRWLKRDQGLLFGLKQFIHYDAAILDLDHGTLILTSLFHIDEGKHGRAGFDGFCLPVHRRCIGWRVVSYLGVDGCLRWQYAFRLIDYPPLLLEVALAHRAYFIG